MRLAGGVEMVVRSEVSIGWLVRGALAMELLFGLVGASALVLAPEQTETNFAWALKPTPMAATLGAFYLASAGMLLASLFARRWEQVRAVVLPAAVTAASFVSTVLHWDRFAHGTPRSRPGSSAIWSRRSSFSRCSGGTSGVPGHSGRSGRALPTWFRGLYLINAGALGSVAHPDGVPATDPRARAVGANAAQRARHLRLGTRAAVLLAMVGLERVWERVRIAALWPLLIGPALVFQLVRFADEVTWTNPWLLLGLADCVLLTLATGWLWARGLVVRCAGCT